MKSHAIRAAVLAFAMVLLNAVLTIYMWLPEYQFIHIVTTTFELLGLYLLMYLSSRLDKKRDVLVVSILGIIVAGVFFFSAGEAFTRFWYDQAFVPATDLRFIPAVLEMVLHVETQPVFVPIIIVIILGVIWLLFRLIGVRMVRSIRKLGPLYLVIPALLILSSVSFGFSRPISALVGQAFEPTSPPVSVVSTTQDTHDPGSFPFADDADVFLIIVESYGYTLFSNPPHRELIMPFYETYKPAIARSGLSVFSSFLDSPTTGGRSWLADATLWTGARVSSQQIYDDLVGSGVVNIQKILSDAGYYSALLAPGTKEADDEWRRYYYFDEYRFRWDFDYSGPFFNLGAMPDQFILKKTADSASGPDRQGKPYFATVILVSSHVPFDRVPPYVEDWESLGNGEIYESLEMRLFENNWLGGNEYPEGYTASIIYSLTSVFDFLMQYLPQNALAIVVGDHQPRIPVREKGASSSVPIHVFSKRQELTEAFSAFGYTDGLVPRQPLPHRGMELFQSDLLAVMRGIPTTAFTP